MNNSVEFINASNIVKNLNTSPSNDEMLELYSCYKQATCGNNTTSKPGVFDFKASKKWQAWSNLNNMSTYDAEVKYILLASSLISRYGVKS
jgi:diazepam-binding inhibitor (GABA receptor modulating acyl-CoA-binding protein)